MHRATNVNLYPMNSFCIVNFYADALMRMVCKLKINHKDMKTAQLFQQKQKQNH